MENKIHLKTGLAHVILSAAKGRAKRTLAVQFNIDDRGSPEVKLSAFGLGTSLRSEAQTILKTYPNF